MDFLEQTATAADSAAASAAPATANTDASHADTTQVDPLAPPADDLSDLASLLPADHGLEEIEHEGIKAKVPKELREAFLRQQDYTRKTQEVAEQRRMIEARAAEVQRQSQFHQQNIAEFAGIVAIDRQLAEYQKLDLPTRMAQATTPEEMKQLQLADWQMRKLQGERAQLAQGLTQKQQQQALNQQQATARQIQESQRELERDIKGWSPEVASKLTDYGKKIGFPDEVLANVTNPAFVKVLHKAWQMDQLIAQRATKPKPAPAEPVSRVTGQAAASTKKPLSEQGVDDFIRSRQEWIRKNR